MILVSAAAARSTRTAMGPESKIDYLECCRQGSGNGFFRELADVRAGQLRSFLKKEGAGTLPTLFPLSFCIDY